MHHHRGWLRLGIGRGPRPVDGDAVAQCADQEGGRRHVLNADRKGGLLMIRCRLRALWRLAVLLPALAMPITAFAPPWPPKPVHVTTPWPPGGPADLVARPILEKLSQTLGQPFIMDNRTGANGT